MSNYKVTNLYNGGFWSNVYCLGEEGGPCIIIDMGDNHADRIGKFIQKHHSQCLGILLTHGHFDHIYGLSQRTGGCQEVSVYLHTQDIPCLSSPKRNASEDLIGEPFVWEGKVEEIYDGLELFEGSLRCLVLHTPFHTVGSCCFYFPDLDLCFTGDTLFHLGVGRDDLAGSAPQLRDDSLGKLMKLSPNTSIFPGHGPKTALENELQYNPYLSSKNWGF